MVSLKLKLNYEERTYVENNRFPKIHLTEDSSSDEDPKNKPSYTAVKFKSASEAHPDHQRSAS